ncbi:MAG: T9SS type A sorting domain-containing protein [Bacteroidales bacterium]|jgi:hypothetical protein|nr:T9SS type A sorting domain-containing protein [Bacteroidales bacterium]
MVKKKCFIVNAIFAFILLQQTVTAQTVYQLTMDSVFEIPKNKVTTGVLIERSPNIVDMQGFDLDTANSIVCNTNHWLELFYRIYASHLNMKSFKYDINIAKYYPLKVYPNDTIPLGFIFYDYDKIKSNAIQTGLLAVDTVNYKITDISGSRQSPLERATCFAMAPLTDTIFEGTYEFILPQSLFVSNRENEIDEINIDFGDGNGFISVYPDEPVTVSYEYLGNIPITIQTVTGSESYTTTTSINVKQTAITNLNNLPDFEDKYNVVDVPGIKAYYGIWYRCNSDNTIKKPILIAAGFDPDDVIRINNEDPDKGKTPKKHLYNIANKDGFLDSLRMLGYDIIVYRSANSTKSVIDNAENFIEFIQKINNEKTSDNELIILGASMGGLVVRYALTKMEYDEIHNNKQGHQTKLFISMDSPQNGANVPLGFQYLVYYLNEDTYGQVEQLTSALEKALMSDAAKQMIIYHFTATSGKTAKCHQLRTDYLNNLAAIGNFPQKCETMAISMGSGNATNQGFAAGATLINKPHSILISATLGLTLDVLLPLLGLPMVGSYIANSLSWDFKVKAVPNQTETSIYQENFTIDHSLYNNTARCIVRSILFGFPCPCCWSNINEVVARDIKVNNTQPLDNAPGSVKQWHNFEDLKFGTTGYFLDFWTTMTVDQNKDCFIPAYSALGLNLSTAPHTNIKDYLNNQSGVSKVNGSNNFYKNTNPAVSPFHYLYIENINNYHIYDPGGNGVFTANMFAAMDEMISSKRLYLSNKTVNSGQHLAYEATELIEAGGNFVVESGGRLKLTSEKVVLKHGFHAKHGSNVTISSNVDWVCYLSNANSNSPQNPSSIYSSNVNAVNMIDNKEFTITENESSIKIFPNPVEEILSLELNTLGEQTTVYVYNISGELIFQQNYSEINTINIDFSKYNQGTYIVKIKTGEIFTTGKIIKQ